jgi:dihydrofolate synthase / folylpolyglutamate synthase
MEGTLSRILDRSGGESRIHYSLDHFNEALAECGNPEKSVKTLVIAGTNGKGSVSLFLSSALKQAGKSVGTYLSPHLVTPTERFLDNGLPVDLATLDVLAAENEAVFEKFRLTYFEALTLMAFQWAKHSEFDILVLEVGMGGRLDATNVTDPLGCVLTTIDWDHQKFLGNTLEAILNEKMGVFRPGVPVWCGVQQPELRALVKARCEVIGSPLCFAPTHAATRTEWEGQDCVLDGHPFRLTNPSPGARENAALALSALRSLFPEIPLAVLKTAFATSRNPGRLETVSHQPRVVLSGDHNPAGIECLIATLKELKARPRILCGFSPDKPYKALVERLLTCTDDLVTTQIARLQPMPPDYQALPHFDPSAENALQRLLQRCAPEETILITGSLYLVGQLRPLWVRP